jgi:cysteine synthase A
MEITDSVLAAIGNTPLIKLKRASEETGCTILGKAEFMNPGASVKDRAALGIITDAIDRGELRPGGLVVDGTAGNTGIGLAIVANALGLKTVIVIPETQAQEKKDTLRSLGATLIEVPAVPYRNDNNYVKVAGRTAARLAREHPQGAIFANQFDNVANRDIHVRTTGPEIWEQTDGKVDGFVSAIGTGGTLAGVAMALRERNPDIAVALADVPGAAMHSFYTTGELKAEGSSITEGIGQGRVTANLEGFKPDHSFFIPDAESLATTFAMLKDEGLALGLSSGVNVAGAIRLARELGPGHTIVTMLCDPATRYQSRLFNPEFLRSKGLEPPEWLERPVTVEPDFLPVPVGV